jgi:hypothetical protein
MRDRMQAAFTVREMALAFMIARGEAELKDLKQAQRVIVEQALQTNKG